MMKREQGKGINDSVNGRPGFGRSLVLVGAIAALIAAAGSPAVAQDRFEISGFGGYTFSEGIDVLRADLGPDFVNEVDVDSAPSYGGAVNYWLNDQTQVGFQFGLQDSSLLLKGSSEVVVTDLKVYNYHGVYTYNAGTSGARTRPFFMFGLGATQYKPSDLSGVSFDSEVKFSGTVGGGVKVYPNERVGFRFTARWTPTYISSSVEGVYCSPYWSPWYGSSCAVLEQYDFSNQFELSAGIILRL